MGMEEFRACQLCEWRCGVDRKNERGVCNVSMPEIAYTCLAESLQSYSITLLGCNFRCLYCNAYRLSQYPDTNWFYRGYVDPRELAHEAIEELQGAGFEKLGFTGGEPTIHLPYIEAVVKEAKKLMPALRIGFTTNGFATPASMERIVEMCSYITLEINAYRNDTHLALSGAPVTPVLRNAEYLIKRHREKIRAIKTVVVPQINDAEIEEIAHSVAAIDPSVPYHLIGFRPSFMLYYHPGPSASELEAIARRCETHLETVTWGGAYPQEQAFAATGAELARSYARSAGCIRSDRNCGLCSMNRSCPAVLREPWLCTPGRGIDKEEDV